MKQLLLKLVLMTIIAAPTIYILRPRYFKMINHIKTKGSQYSSNIFDRPLRYRFYKPKINNFNLYPLIISLHGAAERGSDNLSQIDGIASTFMSNAVQHNYPTFILMPQCPKGTQWVNTCFTKAPFGHYDQSKIPESPEMKMIIAVVKQLTEHFPIDTSRIYVGGFSMGGSGTWDIITRYPHLFAAAFIISGVSDISTAKTIKHTPVWVFNGEFDNIAPQSLNKAMCEAISQTGGKCKLTIYNRVGHYCINHAMNEPGFITWLYKQKKE